MPISDQLDAMMASALEALGISISLQKRSRAGVTPATGTGAVSVTQTATGLAVRQPDRVEPGRGGGDVVTRTYTLRAADWPWTPGRDDAVVDAGAYGGQPQPIVMVEVQAEGAKLVVTTQTR